MILLPGSATASSSPTAPFIESAIPQCAALQQACVLNDLLTRQIHLIGSHKSEKCLGRKKLHCCSRCSGQQPNVLYSADSVVGCCLYLIFLLMTPMSRLFNQCFFHRNSLTHLVSSWRHTTVIVYSVMARFINSLHVSRKASLDLINSSFSLE